MSALTRLASRIQRLLLVSVLSVAVLSCGGETVAVTAGISGTGIVVGVITAFGSIYVNGVKYDVDSASFDVDGDTTATQQNLGLGMVVRLEAKSTGVDTGIATSVVYDDAIEGPISNITGTAQQKEFTILGQTVVVDATSTSFDGKAFADFVVNDLVEVSGFVDSTTNKIIATRIEYKDSYTADKLIEIRGLVSSPVTPNTSFVLNGFTVDITTATLDDLDQGLSEGALVEVKGRLTDANTIEATHVEGEDDDLESLTSGSGSLSLHGVVAQLNSVADTFTVNGVSVDASGLDAKLTDQLANGVEVEVEGKLESGVLVAEALEFRGGEAHFHAEVESVVGSTVTIGFPNNSSGTIALTVDSQSLIEDEANGIDPFTVANLGSGDDVDVEAKLKDGDLVVTRLKRTNLYNEYQVEGVVDSKTATSSMELFGLTFTMDAGTSFTIAEVPKTATDFFDEITVGITKVELEDTDGDGDIDEAEID